MRFSRPAKSSYLPLKTPAKSQRPLGKASISLSGGCRRRALTHRMKSAAIRQRVPHALRRLTWQAMPEPMETPRLNWAWADRPWDLTSDLLGATVSAGRRQPRPAVVAETDSGS